MSNGDSFQQWKTHDDKLLISGSIYLKGEHRKRKMKTIRFPVNEHKGGAGQYYMACIWLTMIFAYGGDFDEHDTIYADIFTIDGTPPKHTTPLGYRDIMPVHPQNEKYKGRRITGNHFGEPGDMGNMGISAYTGQIDKEIIFRLFAAGDDHIGASYLMKQLTRNESEWFEELKTSASYEQPAEIDLG